MIPFIVAPESGVQLIPVFLHDSLDGFYRVTDWSVTNDGLVSHQGIESAGELVCALIEVFPCMHRKYFEELVSAVVLAANKIPDQTPVHLVRAQDRYSLSVPEQNEMIDLIQYKELTKWKN